MFSLERNEKITVKIVEDKLGKVFLTAYEEIFDWDTSFYSVSQFLNNFPDLPLFTSFVFSNDR